MERCGWLKTQTRLDSMGKVCYTIDAQDEKSIFCLSPKAHVFTGIDCILSNAANTGKCVGFLCHKGSYENY